MHMHVRALRGHTPQIYALPGVQALNLLQTSPCTATNEEPARTEPSTVIVYTSVYPEA